MNHVIFGAALFILCSQRLAELIFARRNETWMRQNRAIEFGRQHYLWIVILHVGFLLSLSLEGWIRGPLLLPGWPLIIIALGFLQLLRYWCIFSLGRFWNTRILIIPGTKKVSTGLYRLLRHPNYVIVIFELLFWPLLFSCWYTLLWAGLANAIVLRIRIREENKALTYLV